MTTPSRILAALLSGLIALTSLWPGSTVMAQQVAATLDKNDPELRAVLAQIEWDIEKQRQEKKIAGLSVAIVHDQEVLLARGFGYADVDKKVPADPTTIYRVGSVTKLFTALMLMQLRDAGKLNLDDPIEKYLPEFKIKSPFPDARPATFRQVAAYYSGLPIEPPMQIEYENPEKFPSVEEQLKSLKDVEMIVPAMSMFAYSNLGYNIMGLALARVAKQPYTQYVDQHILKPLGLVLTIPEVRPRSVVGMKEVPLNAFGDNVFHVGGGSFGGNFVTFETGSDGSMRLKWRNLTFIKQP